MKPVLQVALDLMHLKRALEICEEAVNGGVDWIEAGTPLIKSEGVEALRELKRLFPDRTLVADLKTMDVGGMEVEIAAKAGADIVTVMGVADNGTISESVLVGRKYGTRIMVDLMNVEDKIGRTREVAEMGAAYVCLHVAIDEQMKGGKPPEEIVASISKEGIPIAVAGGISAESAPGLIEAGASIIIVGGGIIKAEDVSGAAARVKKAMESGESISTELSKKYGMENLFTAFGRVSTPNIADAQHKRGVMRSIVPRINRGTKMVGRALTVQTSKGDWAKPVEAIDRAVEGDVIVVDAGGSEIAVWGELASWSCKLKGIAGIVIDGAARDIDTILDIDFPCFSRNLSPDAGEPKGFGGIGIEIVCGGQQVRTGDWIVGDESGVVVVPQEQAVEIANRAVDVNERENRIREEIKRGRTLSSVQELEKWEQIR
ncbi:MAG: bifunctional hexulose-6-phosphate synthase/ribonuclease regulator [Methanomassiliicoccales archaeon]|nr:bifunctional hexulose-6-phosphate synthase/ribonuclease regulator [Methanomassiliicoccales archaeon]NYT16228.1 bifunctional hexulose-6-phosphate synthase/ribonuclease regulator [Methanomassiliicoccales archaeon]